MKSRSRVPREALLVNCRDEHMSSDEPLTEFGGFWRQGWRRAADGGRRAAGGGRRWRQWQWGQFSWRSVNKASEAV